MFLVNWWKDYQEYKKKIAEIDTVAWKEKNLMNVCPFMEETIFKYKCSVNGFACIAFDCYVNLPSPKDETEQAEYLD